MADKYDTTGSPSSGCSREATREELCEVIVQDFARIRELEAALARKDAALAAADKKIITARALAKDAMLKGQLPENEHAIKLVNADIELCGARALIAAALKAEELIECPICKGLGRDYSDDLPPGGAPCDYCRGEKKVTIKKAREDELI